MPICAICGFEGIDLSRHIRYIHNMIVKEYRQKYDCIVIDQSVEKKRRETCEAIHGNPNYKNEEAKRLSNEIYQGGHSLSDPKIRKKASDTKLRIYGDANYTNRDKAQKTCLERYGVDNPNKIEGVKEKRIGTLIEKYGRIFNYDQEDTINKETLIQMHYEKKMTLIEIGEKLNVTEHVVSYWMKKHGLSVIKRVVSPASKEYVKPVDIIKDYFETCKKHNTIFSFYKYGEKTEEKKKNRMKRLFNKGKRYHYLREELYDVSLKPELWDRFLKKIK